MWNIVLEFKGQLGMNVSLLNLLIKDVRKKIAQNNKLNGDHFSQSGVDWKSFLGFYHMLWEDTAKVFFIPVATTTVFIWEISIVRHFSRHFFSMLYHNLT